MNIRSKYNEEISNRCTYSYIIEEVKIGDIFLLKVNVAYKVGLPAIHKRKKKIEKIEEFSIFHEKIG